MRYRDLSVRRSVGPIWQRLGQLGAQRLGPATRAVQTVDASAHGRRSAAIGGSIITVSPRDNLLPEVVSSVDVVDGSVAHTFTQITRFTAN